ncbi:Aste57867_18171 [Aphanomyces stellatus]|uniref:Aste57867_18171 protein n=1 Tax=Aphanomyces stellatus TaxID=120398 RepID=A0A485L9N1_9STRA|nr:hypothetical protein As57867_018109 [Aphanomyces stellatus]VFT94909.1 Aste57867_18171 [Aphanomyces stellatus]
MARGRRASSASNTCVVCCLSIDNKTRFQTIGPCNHVGCCSVCALRMRQLLKSKQCIMCKAEMERVICITEETQTFEGFQDWGDNIGPNHVFDEASGIFFVKENIKTVQAMRNLTCGARNCPDKSSFPNIKALKQHTNQKHGLTYCDICLDHKHVFLQEQELYTAAGLKKHKTAGNPDEGFNGHPKCDFCQNRFYGNTELYDHLRKNHFECEICLHAYGIENRYYKDYNDMENHFRSDHFLCEEPQCLAAKFVVFKNHIEFQAHMTKIHPNVRVSRKIDVNFSIRRADRDGRDAYTGSGDVFVPTPAAPDATVITVADFPALVDDGSTMNFTPWQSQSIRMPRQEDFPQLAPSAAPGASAGYRNAITPQPTAAMRAHMSGNDPWEYPEMQQAVDVLGANNPFLRLVKPTKKKKNKQAHASPSPPPPEAKAAPVPAPVVVEVVEEEKPAEKQESVIESIQAALGSEAKYIQFREVCKRFRQKDIPAVSFYSLARAMFKPQDLIELFPKLMSLLPDDTQVTEVLVLHNGSKLMQSANAKLKKRASKTDVHATPASVAAPAPTPAAAPQQVKSLHPAPASTAAVAAAPARTASAAPSINAAEENWPAPQPTAKPAAAAAKVNRRAPAPAASGWGNALKEVGAVPVYSKKGKKLDVVLNNTDKSAFNARAKNTKKEPNNVVGWSSSASWSEPVSAPMVSAGLTPQSSKIQVVSADSVHVGFQDMNLQSAGKAPSRNRSDFPELPKAGPPIGMQHVAVESKHPVLAAWAAESTPVPEAKPKKNKKGKMSLQEFAMLSK